MSQHRDGILRHCFMQGLKLPTGVLEHLSSGHLEETVSRLQRIGINAAEMPQKLMAYPGLFKQLQEPKYMQVRGGEGGAGGTCLFLLPKILLEPGGGPAALCWHWAA
jgi:hypothetical protein